jgi:LysR family hydrogen peroxide-inducible transcriptional activator
MPSSSLAGLSLRDLEYAVAVAETRHFGRAAERCGVSQAGLSEQVRKLEGLLGVALFERTTRRISVTPEGEVLLQQARDLVDAARALLDLAQRRAEPLDGPVRVGVIATLGPYYLPGLLREVRASFPRMQLRLEEGRTASLLKRLRATDLDAVLLALPVGAEDIVASPLFFEPFRAALPVGHPLATRERLSLKDLAGRGLLLLEEGHCLRDQALSLCGATAAEHGSRLASSLEMLRHMIAAGEGHSLLPLLATQERAELDGLVLHRDLESQEAGRVIGLAWRNSDPRNAAFLRLARFLASTAPSGTTVVDDGSDIVSGSA